MGSTLLMVGDSQSFRFMARRLQHGQKSRGLGSALGNTREADTLRHSMGATPNRAHPIQRWYAKRGREVAIARSSALTQRHVEPFLACQFPSRRTVGTGCRGFFHRWTVRACSGSGLLTQCLARCQRALMQAKVARTAFITDPPGGQALFGRHFGNQLQGPHARLLPIAERALVQDLPKPLGDRGVEAIIGGAGADWLAGFVLGGGQRHQASARRPPGPYAPRPSRSGRTMVLFLYPRIA